MKVDAKFPRGLPFIVYMIIENCQSLDEGGFVEPALKKSENFSKVKNNLNGTERNQLSLTTLSRLREGSRAAGPCVAFCLQDLFPVETAVISVSRGERSFPYAGRLLEDARGSVQKHLLKLFNRQSGH